MSLAKKIMIVLGISISSILAFLIILYGLTSFLTSGLKTPIEKQLAALRAEDYATAYSYTTREFQETTTFETFKRFVETYPALRNNKSISYHSREIENNIGNVEATLKSRGGVETPVRYQLIKENNVWKIQAFILQPDENTSTNPSGKQHSAKPSSSITNNSMSTQPPAADNNPSSAASLNSSKSYEDTEQKFSISYPANWSYNKVSEHQVTFTPANSSISPISVFDISFPGYHRSVHQFTNDLILETRKTSTNVTTIDQGPVPMQAQKKPINAKYIVYSYMKQGSEYKSLAVIFYQKEKLALYALIYTESVVNFEASLPIAKAMVGSFSYL